MRRVAIIAAVAGVLLIISDAMGDPCRVTIWLNDWGTAAQQSNWSDYWDGNNVLGLDMDLDGDGKYGHIELEHTGMGDPNLSVMFEVESPAGYRLKNLLVQWTDLYRASTYGVYWELAVSATGQFAGEEAVVTTSSGMGWTDLVLDLSGYPGLNDLPSVYIRLAGENDNEPYFSYAGPVTLSGEYQLGRLYHVDELGGSDANDHDGLSYETAFATIGKGIETAINRDTVLVWPGVYISDEQGQPCVDFNGKDIILTSSDPCDPNIVDNTVIAGYTLYSGTESVECALRGFTIRNNDPCADTVIVGNNTQATISRCFIRENVSCSGTVIGSFDGVLRNCLVVDNLPGDCAQSPVIFGGSALIQNCTIANNPLGMFLDNATLENCIIYDNQSFQFGVGTAAEVTVSYCNIQGGLAAASVVSDGDIDWKLGNIDQDPCFVNSNDYHLKSQGWRYDPAVGWVADAVTSRCIDAGNPGEAITDELLTVPGDPCSEYGVNLRVNMGAYGGTADASMGPYDWALVADVNNDGTVDLADLAVFGRYWLSQAERQPCDSNRDGIVNNGDFANFAADWLKTTEWAD